MILTNIESVPGMVITAQYGLVTGSTVRAKNAIKDFGAGLKNMVGGELKSYTELLTEARKEAISRMEQQAQRMGANAVMMCGSEDINNDVKAIIEDSGFTTAKKQLKESIDFVDNNFSSDTVFYQGHGRPFLKLNWDKTISLPLRKK